MKTKTAIILAAGKGTRMNSDLPKVLHPVCDRPMLTWVLDACRQAGCTELIVVIGHRAELVRETYADATDIVWVEQTEQLGTGHAVMVCRDVLAKLSGPVLVVAGDGPLIRGETLTKLVNHHIDQQAAVTLATCILSDPAKYGRIVRDEKGDLAGIVETLDATEEQRTIREVNVSVYCYDAAPLHTVLGELRNDTNAKGEYYLTDTLELLRARGEKLAAVPAVPPEEVVSINTLDELQDVQQFMSQRIDNESKEQEA